MQDEREERADAGRGGAGLQAELNESRRDLAVKAEMLLQARIQVGSLESELRSARDVARLRADMDLERMRSEAEWQRRLSADEVIRFHELEKHCCFTRLVGLVCGLYQALHL